MMDRIFMIVLYAYSTLCVIGVAANTYAYLTTGDVMYIFLTFFCIGWMLYVAKLIVEFR